MQKYKEELHEVRFIIRYSLFPWKILTENPEKFRKYLEKFLSRKKVIHVGVSIDDDSIWLRKKEKRNENKSIR